MAVAMIAMMAVVYRSGSAATRNPVFLIFPLMMLVSVVGTTVLGRDRRGNNDIDDDRNDYLDYLSGLRTTVAESAAAQRASLMWCHPQPEALWTLVGGPRMWERRASDADFGRVRVGVGSAERATRLVPPQTGSTNRVDPLTDEALRRFLETHASIADVPATIGLVELTAVSLDGDPSAARGLLRALICQLVVLHGPDVVLVAAVISERNRKHWSWLKWLPHHQHPLLTDRAGPARMGYASLAAAEAVLTELSEQLADRMPHVVVVVDGGAVDGTERAGVTIVEVGPGHAAAAAELVVRRPAGTQLPARPDRMDLADALVCARRLAGYRVSEPVGVAEPGTHAHWLNLVGIADAASVDPNALWGRLNRKNRLRVPIGTDPSGAAVHLDIKEAAENGSGPHGLCIGATGSGKSEFLRTVVLGMISQHAPEVLNLVLVDFKGGATFLGLERARHVAAVITNLADEAPLVARMRDALAGEINRRQQLLRTAGNFVSVAAYDSARRAGASLSALPALFIIVDEFSELLAQHPDFVDMFVAIGRLGRSLGIHLLLASQRLDEGRLRGLESHLSYRVCLKTLSASESRAALGVPDAYELPNTPGLGYLRTAAGELTRFQTAFVSGPCGDMVPAARVNDEPRSVQLFTAAPCGPVTGAEPAAATAATERTVLQTVLDRLCGHGPPAHEVWLPPLGAAPALDTVLDDLPERAGLVVPIGIVDCPFEQRRTPLLLDLRGAAGNVAVIGAPQSGKSTALATLVTALAASHDPADVQLYCLDFGGGVLPSLAALPHVGSVAGRADADLIRRTISEMETIVAGREALFRDRGIGSFAQYRQLRATGDPVCGAEKFGDVFLVIDGWASLCRDFDALEAPIVALAGRGLSFGVHVVLSASRWAELRPGLRDQVGTRIELRLGDPADSEFDRRQAQQVPRDKPGRGLTDGGLHALIALPRLDGVDSPSGLARAAAHTGELLRGRHGDAAAPAVPLLPALVTRQNLIQAMAPADDGCLLLGVAERGLDAVTMNFERQPHLLVIGDNECGKTSVLRTLCREIVRTSAGQAQLVVIDYRRSLLGVVDTNRSGGYATSAATLSALLPALLDRLARRMPGPEISLEQLRDRSWWTGPQLYLVVDDYDLVATAAGNPLTPLLEYLPHSGDVGLHLVVARRSGGAARAVYEPLLAALRDLGCMGLMMSGNPDEGPLIGSARPTPLPPGRGTLVTRSGGEQLVQVAWSP
jgi:S-DNA-T family DNA segregation ATPase FtsK/SpoIIIE